MKNLFYVLLLLPSLSFAGQAEIADNLKASGFLCNDVTVDGCTYKECSGNAAFYPKEIYFALPAKISSVRLHFHGHILNLPETRVFEGSPSKMIKGFQLQKDICQSEEVVIIPQSIGKNDTYKAYFAGTEAWEKFKKGLALLLKMDVPTFHLSGHSGGGKFVGLALDNKVIAHQVSLYDGVYSDETIMSMERYMEKKFSKFLFSAVADQSPDRYLSAFMKRFKVTEEKIQLKNQAYTLLKHPDMKFFRRMNKESGSHFTIVTETWSLR